MLSLKAEKRLNSVRTFNNKPTQVFAGSKTPFTESLIKDIYQKTLCNNWGYLLQEMLTMFCSTPQ